MKSLKIPMTVEEFENAEFPFGWKDEYCDGFAYLTPREHGVLMKISVERRPAETFAEIRPIAEVDRRELIELFYVSFVESVEFCDYSKSEIKKLAARNVRLFFDGKRGAPSLELSRCAVLPEDERLIGACLVSRYTYGYKNEILFVRPEFQKKGVGTALVSGVLNELDAMSEKIFWSEYHICNLQSRTWHEKFGFAEVTDILTAKLRRNHRRRAFWRSEQLGDAQRAAELKPLVKEAESEVERLKKIEDEDFDAAWLRWKYDY